jgi:hypothetical protein
MEITGFTPEIHDKIIRFMVKNNCNKRLELTGRLRKYSHWAEDPDQREPDKKRI